MIRTAEGYERVTVNGKDCLAVYIGDGVYALWDGYGVWLHTGDHKYPSDKVYLEPSVLENLVKFVAVAVRIRDRMGD